MKADQKSREIVDGGKLCVRTLKAAGCGPFFCLHGGHLDTIFQACLDEKVELIDMRHEAAVGHAADAFARQTGRVAVAIVTAGPGFTNVLTAVTQAWLDRSPVLFIIGAAPLRDAEQWPLQGGIDQVAMVRPVTKWAGQVTRTELIPHLIGHALRMTREGAPGPVALEIPIDVLFNRVEQPATIPAALCNAHAPAPDQRDVDAALTLLKDAKRPAILCGGGMLFSQASAPLAEFATLTGIPVFTNNKARGALPSSHPLCAGPLTNIKVAQASGLGAPDVVLTLGLRFGMFTEPGLFSDERLPPDGCRIIQNDIAAAELGRVRAVDIAINADCGATLNALLASARGIEWPDRTQWSTPLRQLVSWHRQVYGEAMRRGGPIHPYAAVAEIIACLDPTTIICADGGESSAWVEMLARPECSGGLMSHGYLGCLGIGMPFAIGAQIAHPDRRVVAIVGDGSVGFNIQEFDTMVRHDLPIVTIVLNNKAWGMCVHGQQAMFGDNRIVVTTLGDARYDQVAMGFGCVGEFVDRLDDIRTAVTRALESGKPACIDILTDVDARLGARPDTNNEKQEMDRISMPYYADLET